RHAGAAPDRHALFGAVGAVACGAARADRDRTGPERDQEGHGMTRRQLQKIVTPIIGILVFLALWEFWVWYMGWPTYKMAAPSDLWPAFWQYRELFLVNAWQTLWRTVVGLGLAVVVGTILGMIMGLSRVMNDALYPLLVGFNAIPKATVVPVVALIFIGQHDFNTILVAFMISFFPISVSIAIGLSTLEPEYRDILRSLGASRFTVFWKIALPKTLP